MQVSKKLSDNATWINIDSKEITEKFKIYEEYDDGVNLLSVSELQKYTLIKVLNFSIILLSFLCHVKIL